MEIHPSLKEFLTQHRKIVITTHHKPDADALGSSLALYNYFSEMGHTVQVITPSDYPRFLFWMPGNEYVRVYNEKSPEADNKLIHDADIIFCLDFNDLGRIHTMAEPVRASPAVKVMIDHHLEPSDFCTYTMSYPRAAATCELVYDFIVAQGHKGRITVPIAECLYAGIMTDTGSFRFPSTTKKIHLTIAELIEIGADNSKVHRLVYDTSSEMRLRFIGYALSEKLKVLYEYRTAYFSITAEELRKYQSQTGDTEGLVNYALGIEGIVLAIIIIEREDAVKLSFRSAGEFYVNKFAQKHFQGGGHKNAAGGKSDVSLADTEKHIIELLKDYKEELLNI